MKILLIQPPRWNKSLSLLIGDQEPLNLETIAGMLSQHEVKLLDMRFDEDKLLSTLETYNPDIVGITTVTCEYNNSCEVLQKVKSYSCSILTVVGGVHATLVPEDFNRDFVDVVVLGEGEITFKELAEAYELKCDLSAVKGIALKKNGRLFFTEKRELIEDLNSISLPNRALTREHRQFYSRGRFHPIASIYSTKGCPYRCSFCCTWITSGKKFRTRGVDIFIKDLANIEEYYIIITDDNTIHDNRYSEELFKAVDTSGIKKEYQFFGRTDTIVKNPALLEKWRRVGLKRLLIGVEHLSDKRLRSVNKGTTQAINKKALEILRDLDIDIIAYFIVEPDFEKKDFDAITRYCNEMQLSDPVFTCLTAFPGTLLYHKMKDQLIDENYELFDTLHCLFKTKLPKKLFYEYYLNLYQRAYLNNYNKDSSYADKEIEQLLGLLKKDYDVL